MDRLRLFDLNNIEAIIFLLLLFMAVPDLCRKLRRPALAFSVFVLFGIVLAPFTNSAVHTMLHQAGYVGFLLLLFEVGLEIELPKWRDFVRPMRFGLAWALLQYPIIFGGTQMLAAWFARAGWLESFIIAAALTGCSVGMAHQAWKNYPGMAAGPKQFVLHVMVALELLAMALLAVETAALGKGLSWVIGLKILGIVITVYLIARFAARLRHLMQTILERATHWRLHFLTLLVLGVCALGERLGLDAAKTAFFLGLFMSRVQHDGMSLEDYIAPISRRFLIPVFFVSLGLQIEWKLIFQPLALLALGTALLLIGWREILHRRWLKTGGDAHAFLLLSPNLTLVALAASVLLEYGRDPKLAAWLVLTGLFVTIPAILLLPPQVPRPLAEPPPANQLI